MYSEAKVAAEAGKDAEVGQVYICPVCGWTSEQVPALQGEERKVRYFL
jgi:rubrerythrin